MSAYHDEWPVKVGAEPAFTLRGQDAMAVPAMTAYALACEAHGLDDHAARVHRRIEQFIDWQRENVKHTHLPCYGGAMQETLPL